MIFLVSKPWPAIYAASQSDRIKWLTTQRLVSQPIRMKRLSETDVTVTAGSSELGYALVHQILGASTVLLRESHRFFRPLGISEVQFNVINVLAGTPEGMSQRELSEILVVDRSNITTLL